MTTYDCILLINALANFAVAVGNLIGVARDRRRPRR